MLSFLDFLITVFEAESNIGYKLVFRPVDRVNLLGQYLVIPNLFVNLAKNKMEA